MFVENEVLLEHYNSSDGKSSRQTRASRMRLAYRLPGRITPVLSSKFRTLAMQKTSDFIFKYPPNLQELDLATMVSMYRSRGEPRKAAAGKYLACAVSHKLLKDAKWWFGLYYSQAAWDQLLTKSSEGYPLTETEMNVLGLIAASEEPPHREYVEKNVGVISKLAYLIVSDLKQFGFITEDDQGFLHINSRGDRALQGITRRLYGKRFSPEMLHAYHSDGSLQRNDTSHSDQTTLF